MTESEAIKNVTAYVYMECENMPKQVIQALDIMKDATKKQIPRKVIKWANGTEHCPTCDCDNSCVGYGVCIDCGQKIDWSDTE